MKRFVVWFLLLPTTLGLLMFALFNRAIVDVVLWPTILTVQLPLFLLALGALFAGLLGGSTLLWCPMIYWRRRARRAEHTLHAEKSSKKDL